MSTFVDEDVVRLDISDKKSEYSMCDGNGNPPVNVSQIMNGFNSKNAFCHIKSCDVFREEIIFH